MNRIQRVLEENKTNNKKSFIGYLTAGDPDLDKLEPLLHALEDGGCDVIEIGVPFSDPLADGPVIQQRAKGPLKAEPISTRYLKFWKNAEKTSKFRLHFWCISIPLRYMAWKHSSESVKLWESTV